MANCKRWCVTCTTWKNELLIERRVPFNKWENTESWNWFTHYENIASVFLPFSHSSDIQFDDVSTACHLWDNCNTFNISKAVLTKVRGLRNKHCGHNPNLTVDNVEKTKVFDTLKALVSAPDVQPFLNAGQCIQNLDVIAKGDLRTELMGDIDEKLHELHLKMDFNNDIQNQILGEIKNQRGDGGRLRKTHVGCFLVLIFAVYVCLKTLSTEDPLMNKKNTECFSETYSYPFPQDLHLLPYFKEHSQLFGRNWLFEDIKHYIDDKDVKERGILITADMGYGKSAIVKHVLCSHIDDKAYNIKSHIAAFHLCRFDVPATKNPKRFIHRLVGFLSTHLPEYGALISLLPETSLLYNDEKCRKEIIACFDQGVLHPLLEMKTIASGIKIIMIDALDECYDKRSNANELYELLMARYKKLPKWIQFIVTSRNISLIHKMKHLKHYSLEAADHRNRADIKQYIEYKAALYPALRKFDGGLTKLLDESEGLFLFIVHLLDYLTTNEIGVAFEIPETLSAVYEMNFERHFHSVAEYEIARSILEIVVASLHPLSNYEVVNMLENLNVSNKVSTDNNFEKIKFCFRSFHELTLIHQSLHLWLTSSGNNIEFHISVERGHAMLSRYILNRINSSRTDIVDFAIHIGNSNDSTLAKAFSGIYSNKKLPNSTLHKLVGKSNSARALKLLLNLQIDVDTLNEGNVTPAFVAAANGHLNQLKLLQLRGADLNFKVKDSYLITSLSYIDMIKHDYYFGYRLIHIAAQFGHSEIVSFLLKQNKTLRYVKNGLGLTVAEIVCENGHEKLLQILLNHKAKIGNCIYYAAKNNHNHIVNRLVHLGVNVHCISYADAMQADEQLTLINLSYSIFTLHPDNIHQQRFNLNDLWWVVNQQSPLHAAIKSRSVETAIALIEHYPHLAECVDAFGMTPFLLSVTEKLTHTFELLAKRVKTDTCRRPSDLLQSHPDLDIPICPIGGSYAHLDGIYGRFELTKVLYQRGIAVDWLVPDSNSITAAHYAACIGNGLFLIVLQKYVKQTWSDIRSGNRSTPYHSAAICGSLGAFYAMTDLFKNPPPELYDIENKTLMHYVVMREFTGHPATLNNINQGTSVNILIHLLKYGSNIGSLDSLMRNILHYALKNGHFRIVEYLYFKENVSFKKLIKQRDINGSSPLEYALKSQTSRKLFISIHPPLKCIYYNIFYSDCVNEGQYDQYLSSWEMGIFITLRATIKEDKFNNVFKDILINSPYLTVAMLVYLKDRIELSHLRKQFIESIPYPPPVLSVLAVARHYRELFKACGKLMSESPLHLMAYKYNTHVLMTNNFIKLTLGKPPDTYALNCADNRGYNCFHYALMGGNICTGISLFEEGVLITNGKVSIKDIAWMMLLAKKTQMPLICHSGCDDQLSCMDYLLQRVFENNLDKLLYSDLCSRRSTDLSLIHIVAASGMVNAINILHNKFGKTIFACLNKDRISPMYLWDLFNKQNSINTFNIGTTKQHVPLIDTEELLLLGLLNDFPYGTFDDSVLRCFWSKGRRLKINVRAINCFARVLMMFQDKHFSDYKSSETLITNLKKLLIVLIDFERALHSKLGNIEKALTEIKIWATFFESNFYESRVSFNYPRLKTMISSPFHVKCEQNGLMQYPLYCFQIANEFSHLTNRMTSYAVKLYTHAYLLKQKVTSKTCSPENDFMRKRMRILKKNTEKLSVWNIAVNKSYDTTIIKHRYLNILKKSVKYQYLKEQLKQSCFDMFEVVPPVILSIKSNIPKPFDDIQRFLNASSYLQISDSFQ